jgi:hypothetical protein
MQQLVDSIKKIKEILHKCEEEGDTMADVLGKLGRIKVYKVPFPTMMLMEIIDDFAKGYRDRRRSHAMKGFDEKDLQDKFQEVSLNWNNKDTVN